MKGPEFLDNLTPDERARLESLVQGHQEAERLRIEDEKRFPPLCSPDAQIPQVRPDEFDWPSIEHIVGLPLADYVRTGLIRALNGLLAGTFIRERFEERINAKDVAKDLKRIAGRARRLAESLSNLGDSAVQLALLETGTDQRTLHNVLLRVAYRAEHIKLDVPPGRRPLKAEKEFAEYVRATWKNAGGKGRKGSRKGAYSDPNGPVKGPVVDFAEALLTVAAHHGGLAFLPAVRDALRRPDDLAVRKAIQRLEFEKIAAQESPVERVENPPRSNP